jgi:hypothetical protein
MPIFPVSIFRSIFRLLPFSLLITVGVATLTAQSAPEKNSFGIQPAEAVALSSSSANPFSSNFQTGLNPNAADRILLGDYRPQQSQFSVPRHWLHNNSDWQLPADSVCLKMRTYKVARDGPRTDSTHAAGYSTCTAAARFQTHSIVFTTP